jgi:hypothetical protein
MDRFTPAIAAGSVNVISVAAIREGFGDRWPRKRDQVEAFIERSFVRVAGVGVLVTALNEVEFVSITPDAAGFRALNFNVAVLKETLTFFLGKADRADIRIFKVAGCAAGQLQVEAIDTVHWLDQSDASDEQPSAAPEGDADLRPRDLTTPSLVEIDHDGRARSARLVVSGQPALSVVHTTEPVWNISQRVVTSFLMQPKVYRARSFEKVEPSRQIAEQLATIGIDQAESRLLEGLAGGSKFAAHLPIPFLAASGGATRQRLQQRLRALPLEVRRLLILELTGISDGLPSGRMAETVAALRPHCRAVLARASSPLVRLGHWRQCRLSGVTLDCSRLAPDDPRSMQRLTAFAEEANAVSRTLVGYGLASRSLTLAAWAAGFTHLSGAAVQQTQGRPRAMRWEPTDLYRPSRPDPASTPSAPSDRYPSA